MKGSAFELGEKLAKTNLIYDFAAEERISLSLIDFPEHDNFGFKFNKCDFIHGFDLVDGENERCQIFFNDCSFGDDDLNQFALLKLSSLIFYNCRFGKLSFTDVSCWNVQFKECTFDNLDFYNSEIKKLNILKPNKGKLEIYIGSLKIEQCEFNGNFKKVILDEFQNCRLTGNYGQIELCSENFEKCYLGNSMPNRSEIGNLDFIGKVFQGDVYIQNADINLFEWSGVSSSRGSLRINNVEVEYFRLKNCTINYLEWSNLKLNNYSLGGSNLIGLKVFNVTWPQDKLFEQLLPDLSQWKPLTKREKIFFSQLIPVFKIDMEAYRLLKASSQNNQNEMDALEFYRLEMRRLWIIRRISDKKIGWRDTALLGIGRLVSDFGQNWLLPLIWLFGIHYILFMSVFEWNYIWDWECFKNGLGAFFELLNPVHKTPDYINTGMGLFTEFWMRLFSGFFIFHFVKATRKYGKV